MSIHDDIARIADELADAEAHLHRLRADLDAIKSKAERDNPGDPPAAPSAPKQTYGQRVAEKMVRIKPTYPYCVFVGGEGQTGRSVSTIDQASLADLVLDLRRYIAAALDQAQADAVPEEDAIREEFEKRLRVEADKWHAFNHGMARLGARVMLDLLRARAGLGR